MGIVRLMDPARRHEIREDPSTRRISGALLMALATLLVTGMVICVRMVPGRLHPFQLAFFRNFFGLAALVAWQSGSGPGFLKTRRLRLHLGRGLFNLLAMLAFYSAVFITPMASIAALNFTSPLFASLLAILVLKEPFRLRRLVVIAIGMAGAAIILRPGIQGIGWGPPLILLSAMMWAVSLIFIKALSRTDSSLTIATYMVIVTTPFSLLAAVPVWQWPGGEQLFWMLLVGLLGSAGQICLAQAFKMAEASSVLPFDFLQLIWAALLGFLVFGEVPDRWVWVGGTLIFLSSTTLALKESGSSEVSVP
ncbi:MAG: DMT family transporter [Acidobacteria bacterium]|nr:DMT family transporter [Acidobacteriota bacterium]